MDSARAVLAEQHRVRAVHGVGAIRHGLLQRARLNRDVLGKEPRHRHVALRIAGFAMAWVSAAIAVKWMVAWLNRHGLTVFAWWRVAAAGLAAWLLL